MRLDSRNAVAYAALARIQARLGKWPEAEDLHKQAITLDPNEHEVLDSYANTLAAAGRIKIMKRWPSHKSCGRWSLSSLNST